MSPESLQPRPLTDWPELFAAFERTLAQCLAQVVALEAEPPPQCDEPDALRTFAERLGHLQTYLDRAEERAEQALTPLAVELQSLWQWRETLNQVRVKLPT